MYDIVIKKLDNINEQHHVAAGYFGYDEISLVFEYYTDNKNISDIIQNAFKTNHPMVLDTDNNMIVFNKIGFHGTKLTSFKN